MGSNVLPQALFIIPRNPPQCSSKKLGVSSFVPHLPHLHSSNSVSSSRVLLSPCQLTSSFTKSAKRSFVVRAEADPETTSQAAEDDGGDETAIAVVEKETKPPRKPIVKLGDIMGILNKRAVEASENERPVPDLRTGDVVQIKLEVPENKRRLSIYKGIVMSKQNAGIHTTIRIRRIIAGVGVEIVFPIYSPNIKEIKVVDHKKVRRARLYYLRDKLPRFSTFK